MLRDTARPRFGIPPAVARAAPLTPLPRDSAPQCVAAQAGGGGGEHAPPTPPLPAEHHPRPHLTIQIQYGLSARFQCGPGEGPGEVSAERLRPSVSLANQAPLLPSSFVTSLLGVAGRDGEAKTLARVLILSIESRHHRSLKCNRDYSQLQNFYLTN